MRMNSKSAFRKILNVLMTVSLAGTIPYVFIGDSLYRHEIYGITALILVLYHCLLNSWWYKKLRHLEIKKELSSTKKRRDILNLFLSIVTLFLLFSSIMISDFVFFFLPIPYHDFWHYTHFFSGVVFFILVILHAMNHT